MSIYKPMRSCRLSDDLYLKAKYIANTENRSFNNCLESIIIKIVADYECKNGPIEVNPNELYQ